MVFINGNLVSFITERGGGYVLMREADEVWVLFRNHAVFGVMFALFTEVDLPFRCLFYGVLGF